MLVIAECKGPDLLLGTVKLLSAEGIDAVFEATLHKAVVHPKTVRNINSVSVLAGMAAV